MDWLSKFVEILFSTTRDILPLLVIILGFQKWILKKPIDNIKQLASGIFLVILGLTFFLDGLEMALFPIGRMMAEQLTSPEFINAHLSSSVVDTYFWVFMFAFFMGFTTTIAEPALIAVALKANQVSGGAVTSWGLRVAVAFGVAIGISLGVYRILMGYPLHLFIMSAYIVVIVQTYFAPRSIIPLAFDSGGVTTSTITVPLVAALGLGLAESIPGRSPLIDGFGLIAFACLFPIITVMLYAQISQLIAQYNFKRNDEYKS